jgi:hypothetical protein
MRDRLVLLSRVAIVLVAVALSLARFLAIDAASHSASDTLRPWMIEATVIALVATLAFVAIGRLASHAD